MESIFEPFSFEFFRNGFFAAIMIGILCGIIGVFIVLRGMSYIGHGLSHAAFGGAVLGYMLNLNFYAGAAFAGFLASILIHQLSKGQKIKSDAAIGIVTTAFFALGIAMISRVRQFTQSFEAALFGNILGVNDADLLVIGAVLLLTVLATFFLYKPLLFTTFDNDAAQVSGIRTNYTQLVFSMLLALSIIASMNVVGVTMIAAALVIPASTARMLTDSFAKMIFISAFAGLFMSSTGMYSSYVFDAASGATIVLVGALMFTVVLIVNHVRERIAFHAHVHTHGGVKHSHPHVHDGSHSHQHKGLKIISPVHSHGGYVHSHNHNEEHGHADGHLHDHGDGKGPHRH